ncbi:MAG: DUF4494 domain-containing protein [Cytophagaceae bacterium]
MASWFECKFKYNLDDPNGGYKSITEIYLVDAVSFTDAESRVNQEVGANYRDFSLMKVGKYRVHELVPNDEAITWYKCKVSITTLDEKAGKDKKAKQSILVNANNIREAYNIVEGLFSDSVSDYEILDIVTTSITEVLPYFEEDDLSSKPVAEVAGEEEELV